MKDVGYNKRRRFVDLVERHGLTISKACQLSGISRTYGYKILNRYYEEGDSGLETSKPIPITSPRKISDRTIRKVVCMAIKYPSRGPKWLQNKLMDEGIKVSEVKIYSILKDYKIPKKEERVEKHIRHPWKIKKGLLYFLGQPLDYYYYSIYDLRTILFFHGGHSGKSFSNFSINRFSYSSEYKLFKNLSADSLKNNP